MDKVFTRTIRKYKMDKSVSGQPKPKAGPFLSVTLPTQLAHFSSCMFNFTWVLMAVTCHIN